MPRLKTTDSLCSAARALEILGARWTLLLQVIDRRSRRALPRMRPLDADGNALDLRDLDWIPGPGARDPRLWSRRMRPDRA
jgi:hypothetical protein